MDIPTLEDIGRQARLTMLPPSGAWVCVRGCPVWPRGKRLIKAHIDIGVRHLDIYWGYKEKLTMSPRVNRHGKRNLSLVEAILYDIQRGAEPAEALERAVEELRDFVDRNPFQSTHQTSLVTISHPCPEEVRFFNSEVVVFSADTIRQCLEADWLETKIFGESSIPVLEDAVRDMVEALQVDGLSRAEAYHMVLTTGVEETAAPFVPTWFYRPTGLFRDTFVEQ